MKVRIATRKSPLALVQARAVASALKKIDPRLQVEEVPVSTRGDRVVDKPLSQGGGKGLFIKEVQAALISGEADLAVHCLKDIPGDEAPPDALVLSAFPEREDARDLVITAAGEEFDGLRAGSMVGTASLRRLCQLRRLRPDLKYVGVRGNVGTRIEKVRSGAAAAVVLAMAGIRRLGGLEHVLSGLSHEVFSVEQCMPAVGQGTLAIETRRDDKRMGELAEQLDHKPTRLVAVAERAMLQALVGNCHAPIAGFAQLEQQGLRLRLDGLVFSADGDSFVSACADVSFGAAASQEQTAAELGHEVAEALIRQGAKALIDQAAQGAASQAVFGNGSGERMPWSWKL